MNHLLSRTLNFVLSTVWNSLVLKVMAELKGEKK